MTINKLTIVVGFDQKESVAYHTFCQSIIEKSTIPVQFIPLANNNLYFYNEIHKDGTNKFIYSRFFLTPFMCEYKGKALYTDCDMICNTDIAELISLYDDSKAVQVVKHSYKTKRSIKYLGNKNLDYPRKNWSSLILFNCEHPDNKILTPTFVSNCTGDYLHRFKWLKNNEIGELNIMWNYLAIEYPSNEGAKIIHYTLGTPCFNEYKYEEMSDIWWDVFSRLLNGIEG